jgi:murein DD-endopeptidase MepM/ murein hydrolase activator NlpD
MMVLNFDFMRSTLFFIGFFFCLIVMAQKRPYPTDYFAPPMDIPLFMSGNYGEIRSNHFHGGVDLKTQGVEGLPIKTAAEGYVSRIKVSPFGYGKAIYITHPNGYTTVYGHLKKFSETIEKYVKSAQYQKESFSVELFPMSSELQLQKGDLIAYSGNTGGSGGPHLHFEIRDTKTETPLNVLLFGLPIKDAVKPIIKSIMVYPLNDTSHVNGKYTKQRFNVIGSNGNYRLATGDITAFGEIGFAVEAIDQANGVSNRIGIYQVKLFADEELIYAHEIDQIPFNKSRFINAFIDYEEKVKTGRRFQLSYILPNNQLPIYQTDKSSGRLLFSGSETKSIQYELIDVYGNKSTLSFKVNAQPTANPQPAVIKSKDNRYFRYNRRNIILEEDILVNIPPFFLYDDIEFEFSRSEPAAGCMTKLYNLHNKYTPLQSYMNVSIKLAGLTPYQREKSLIVSSTNGGRSFSAEGGKWENDNISVRSRSFGSYCVKMDTTAPIVTPINISKGANMSNKWSIMMKATDDLSGINFYRGEIDGKWVLFEYDYKKNLFFHYFEADLSKGAHSFTFKVVDGNNNETIYSTTFNN